jgi:hypothetical protein
MLDLRLGEVAEWSKAHVSNTCRPLQASRVQIPPSPHPSMNPEQPKQHPFYEITQETISEQFNTAKKCIEDQYEISLSTIELFNLRKITEKVLQEISEMIKLKSDSHSNFVPWEEIPARFLQEYYGIDPHTLKQWEVEFHDMENVKEFIKRKQIENHHP